MADVPHSSQQQSPEPSEPDGMAEATVFTTPDDQSVGARMSLPAKFAGDVFPTMVILAIVAVPSIALGMTEVVMPWWSVLVLALFVPTLVVGVYAAHRFYWAPPRD